MANITEDRDREILKLWGERRLLGRSPIELPRVGPYDELVSQPFFNGLSETPLPTNPVDLFRDPKNHENAVGRIWTYCSDKTKFIPAMSLQDQADKYNAYVEMISTFPGFFLEYSRETGRKQTSHDINLMINDIKATYDGIIDVNLDNIITSLTNMAQSIINKSNDKVNDAIFTQMAITKPGNTGQIYVSIFYTTLAMEINKEKKKTYRSQEYIVRRALFRVNTSFLTAYAVDLSIMMGLGDWGKAKETFTSPKGGSKMSCFKKHLATATEENHLTTAVRED
ncbi:hypothetical protein BGZ93_001478 [Podila epicladia]|nr:hypothetical protein BGZ92_003171 [Podila epicladia]KAG0083998.1 hypothetical protein BGZ93_001478 [Podila epicladia]